MQELQQPLERGERGRLNVGLTEARLDRLEVPVAEIVEGQVVELADEVREVELGEVALGGALCLRDTRQDPALLDRLWPLGRAGVAGVHQDQAGGAPQLLRE